MAILESAIERITRWCALAAGTVLLLLMLLTVADVAMRSVLGAPIFGTIDISELGLVLVVFLGLAYCGRTGGHVSVDLLESVMSPGVSLLSGILTRLLSVAVLGLLAWRTMAKAADARTYGDVSNLLGIPHWPFLYAIALSAALFALVLVLDAVALLSGRGPEAPKPQDGPGQL